MENPRTVNREGVVKALVNMRAMLIARMRAPHCSPMMYNECRSHVLQIDAQIASQAVPMTLDAIPHRTWTRAQMRKHKRDAGTTFTQRMNERKPEGKKMPLETRGIISNGRYGK